MAPEQLALKSVEMPAAGGRTGGNGQQEEMAHSSRSSPQQLAVIAGGVMLSHQADPWDTVIDAFRASRRKEQLNPSEEISGTKELENLQKGSAQTGMELSMTGGLMNP